MNLTETSPTFRLHAASLLKGMRSACFCDLLSFSTAVIDPLASSLFWRFLYSSLSLFRLLGLVLPELHALPYMCTTEGHDHVMTSGDDIYIYDGILKRCYLTASNNNMLEYVQFEALESSLSLN